MTENKAKTKWCPMSRVPDGRSASNRHIEGASLSSASCLGSECACWVWNEERNIAVAACVPEYKVQEEIEKQKKDKLTFLHKVPDGRTKVMDAPDAITYSLYFEKEPERRQGHCGLCK